MINLIHIGDYKTGTSWLQDHVFNSHRDIYYIDSGQNDNVVRLMHQLVDLRDLDFNANKLRDQFTKIFQKLDTGSKKIVISREALSGTYPTGDHAKRIAERLYATFGETKILIVVREQLSMLRAIYSQYVKMGGTLTFSDFVFDPIISPGLLEKLRYHKIINVYQDIFGSDNVMVVLFESLRSDNNSFVQRLSEFIDCDAKWQPPIKKVVVNPSLKKVGLEIQRVGNRFLRNHYNQRQPVLPIDKIVSIFLSRKKKQHLIKITRNRLAYSDSINNDHIILRYAINHALTLHLSRFCEHIQVGPGISLPDQLQEQLHKEFSFSNKILQNKYGLDLEKFGWPL